MRLLAGLAAGLCVFIVVARLTGHADLSLRLPQRRRVRPTMALWLRQAGVPVAPAQFLAVSAMTGIVVLLICWAISGSPVVGVVPAGAAALGPRAYFARRRAQHLAAVVEAWPDAIRHLLSSIGTLTSVHQALVELARSGPLPMREAFARYADLATLGGVEGALSVIREDLADPISDRVIELLIVANDQGQALAMQILRDQAREVAVDLQTWTEIRTAQAEPRNTARVAFLLLWLVLIALCAGMPEMAAFYRTGAGVVVLVIGGSMASLGLVVARRLSREAGEPRVLGGAV